MAEDRWEFGRELRARRERAGMRVDDAASGSNISVARWRNLESGYERKNGVTRPVATRASTIASAARTVGWDVDDALRTAGFEDSARPTSTTDSELMHLWNHLREDQQAAILATMKAMTHEPSPTIHSTNRTDPALEEGFEGPSANEPDRQDNHG